jgi:hypothetical protein
MATDVTLYTGYTQKNGAVSKIHKNVHNVRIWGTEQPHAQIEHQRDSPKINVFCAVSREKVHGPFFFPDATVTGD